jgi:hypothetical protein
VVLLRGDAGESVVVVISGSGYGEAVVMFYVTFVVWW